MFFQRLKTPGNAHVSYLLGSKGEAAVIDPRRDVDEYLSLARSKKLTIKYVTAWIAMEQPTVKGGENTVTTIEIEGERR